MIVFPYHKVGEFEILLLLSTGPAMIKIVKVNI